MLSQARSAVVAFLLAAACGTVAIAQQRADFPTYHQVTGVASDDVLNIRAEPDAASAIIGGFDPGEQPVEILATTVSGGQVWGMTLLGERNGWVAMRFLRSIDVPLIADTRIPAGLRCFGTEPFWRFAAQPDNLEYLGVDDAGLVLPIASATTAAGRNHRFSLLGIGSGGRMTAIISRGETCSDGMSDAAYGWRVDLLVEGETLRQVEGCCTLR